MGRNALSPEALRGGKPMTSRLQELIRFQKTLAQFAGTTNPQEAAVAEHMARRLMAAYNIDPLHLCDGSLYSHQNFADNAPLKKLRDEWRLRPEYIAAEKRRQNRSRGQQARRARERPAQMEKFRGMFHDAANGKAPRHGAGPPTRPRCCACEQRPYKPEKVRRRPRTTRTSRRRSPIETLK
jgi:hypothetical protein